MEKRHIAEGTTLLAAVNGSLFAAAVFGFEGPELAFIGVGLFALVLFAFTIV